MSVSLDMSLVISQRVAQTAAIVGERRDIAQQVALDYAAFFRAEFTAVTRTAYLVLHDRDAAEDVAQDAFTQLYLNWAKISGYERPDAWVRRIAVRMAVRAASRGRLLGTLLGRLEAPRREGGADLDLAAALRRLPPQQRAAIALHYYEDRPLAEVAQILNCSHATAKVHVFKARRKLATLLGEPEGEGADAT
jgi:RNA polymerase sigma factor (sigma-70 family)